MSTLNLVTATLDDIVFEGRNKTYGAFLLRRLYNRHLTTATFTASALCLLLVAAPLVVSWVWPTPLLIPPAIVEQPFNVIDVILPEVKPPAPPAAARARTVTVTHPAETIPVVVSETRKVVAPPKEALPPAEISPVGPVGAGTSEGLSEGGLLNGNGLGSTGSDSGAAVAPPAKPFSYVEEMPAFAGGEAALRKYLQRNLHYPPNALRNGIAGKVYVSFVVNTTGAITDVEVVKGIGAGCDEEATRVIRAMPAWTPGRQNRQAVAVRYTLPITFRYE